MFQIGIYARFSAIVLSFAVLACASHAIVIRHDRPDARYQALAAKYRGPICVFSGDGLGCLVGKRWVLTAAHVAQLTVPLASYVSFGGRYYHVSKVWTHPDWEKSGRAKTDLALVELSEDVAGVTPARMYEKMDEVGKRVGFAGPGNTGTGLTGDTKEETTWRGAENQVDRVLPNYVRIKFDAPPASLDLEGICGSGDSGTPLLYQKGGEFWVLGIGSDNSSQDELPGGGSCKYGTYDYYARISTTLPWIRETMRTRKGFMDSWSEPRSIREGWPTNGLAPLTQKWTEALNRANAEELAQFVWDNYAPDKLEGVKLPDLLPGAQRRIKTFGTVQPVAITLSKSGATSLLAYSRDRNAWFLIQFIPSRQHLDKIGAFIYRTLPYVEEKFIKMRDGG